MTTEHGKAIVVRILQGNLAKVLIGSAEKSGDAGDLFQFETATKVAGQQLEQHQSLGRTEWRARGRAADLVGTWPNMRICHLIR